MPAPTFVSSSPAAGATNVAKNVSISAVFSTALSSSSVSPKTVILKYTDLSEPVSTSVSLSADGLTVTIVPTELLIPNGGYQILFVGADVSSSCIKAADDTSFAVSVQVGFQTGDSLQIDTEGGLKTIEDREAEGEIVLPEDIGFRAPTGAPLRLLRTSPAHRSFGIDTATQRLRFEFSANVDPTSITSNIEVVFEGFYGQDEYRANLVDNGVDGEDYYFRCQTGDYTGGEAGYVPPAYFEDPSYTISATGTFVDINLTPATGDLLPMNLAIIVNFDDDLVDIDGNPISRPITWMTFTEPYPNWASVGQVRHEIGAFASLDSPDDFVGLRIWQASMDLWEQVNREIDLQAPNQHMKMYVRVRSAIDTFDDLMAVKYLNAGVVKELGDLRIQYNTGAGGTKPRRIAELEKRLASLAISVFGGWTQVPRTGVRSIWDALEPGRAYFRDRLWRAELPQYTNEPGQPGRIAANTEYTRRQR